MEHLLLPPGASPLQIIIPYRASKEGYYDGGDFLTYPRRKGWDEEDPLYNHTEEQPKETFFLTWLYFGFAIEVFKAVGIVVKTEDFLAECPTTTNTNTSTIVTEGFSIITTAKLPKFLAKWKELWSTTPESISTVSPQCRCRSSDIAGQRRVCFAKPCWRDCMPANYSQAVASVCAILDRVQFFLDRYCNHGYKRASGRETTISSRRGGRKDSWPVSDEAATLVMALGFTLRQALRTYGGIQMFDGWSLGTSRTLQAILQVKWCPADVALILGDLEIDGHYYLAASEGQPEEYLREHGSCSELKCVAKMCEATYVTRHVSRCAGKKEQQLCSAKLDDASQPEFLDEVVKAIDRDGTPIIHWDEGKGEVTIQEYNAQRGLRPQYVAISHVWADGMGNPHENWLPNCQLSRIQDMVDELNFPKRDPSKRVGFWMDTLCVPVSNKFKAQKKASIRSMRHIYAQAAAVLVLDSRMQQVPHQDASPAERCAQLYMSAWIRRLWTLQEGVLNRKLFLRWQDGAQDLNSLKDDRLAWEHKTQLQGSLIAFPGTAAAKISLHVLVLQDVVGMIQRGEEGKDLRAQLYLPLCDALSPRATTHDSDETLCLSSILGLDPKVYLDIENKEDPEDVVQRRMEMFILELGKFNTAIIFNSYPKLTRDGVRWAPRSLLGCQTANLGPALAESRSSHIRKVGPYSGLPVRYSAFVLRGVNQPIDQDKITVTFKVRGAHKKSRHGHMHEVVDIWLREKNALRRDPGAMYTVLMADTLRGSSRECGGCIGIVQPLEHELGDVESIKVIRYECGVSLVRRWGKEPEGPLVLVGSSEAEWLVM